MQAVVETKTLSDGSKVYDVIFHDDVIFQCIDFRAACSFCDEVSAAIAKYTNNEFDFYWKG